MRHGRRGTPGCKIKVSVMYCSMYITCMLPLITITQTLSQVHLGVLPKVLQYSRAPNGEWIEFDDPSAPPNHHPSLPGGVGCGAASSPPSSALDGDQGAFVGAQVPHELSALRPVLAPVAWFRCEG